MAENIQQAPSASNDEERAKKLNKIMEKHESRIESLQTSAFQLTNYFFVFQGVILLAVSNTTTLTCSDSWYICTLSSLAAFLNLTALGLIGIKYVRAINSYEEDCSENNRHFAETLTQQSMPHGNADVWIDKYAHVKRYTTLVVCMLLISAFVLVVLAGPWLVICRHDKHRKHPCGNNNNLDCVKLCNGSRCIVFCREGY